MDTSKTRRTLSAGGKSIAYYSIPAAEAAGLGKFSNLPASLKVVLENMLRFEDGKTVTTDDIKAFADWGANGGRNPREIAYRPARVLMQDFTGVPAVVDLAAMRDAMVALGGDPEKINPLAPVDLVIDHSVMVDEFGNPRAFQMNVAREYQRNGERYQFLKWGQGAFDNFRVVPPGTGICHQVNLEYLAQTVWTDKDQNGQEVAYPDTLVGTDSHTTMVNGMAVLGWGVGGIEAEAAMLGSSSSTGPGWTTCPWPTAPPSATWPRNTAPPAASSRSITRPCATCTSRAATRTASRWSRPTPRRTASGAAPTTTRSSPIPWN
jgi:aconitate hydratase